MEGSADRSARAIAGRGAVAFLLALLVVGFGPYVIGPVAPPAWMGAPVGFEIGPSQFLAGTAVVVAGLSTWVVGRRHWTALLVTLIGVTALAPFVVASAPASTFSAPIAAAAGQWLAPLVLLFVLAVTGGARSSGLITAGVATILAAMVVIAVLRAATYDPFYEPACTCNHGSPAIAADASLRGILRLTGTLTSLLAAGAAGVIAARGLWATQTDLVSGIVLVSSVAFGIAVSAIAAMGLSGDLGFVEASVSVQDSMLAVLTGLMAVALLGIAVGVGASTAVAVRSRLRILTLAGSIESAPTPARLEHALGNALGDPDLRVSYWVANGGRYVNGDGAPFQEIASGGTATTFIERGGSPLAMIRHRPLLDDTAIPREFRPGMLLALDNARLRAAGLAHLRDLQMSRARIVEVGDRERRRIERDLHDGAQQGLLALAFDLRVARLAAERHEEADREADLADAETLAIEAGEELRRLARGAHPAVLGQAGLAAALESLADETPIPMVVEATNLARLSDDIESSAYRVITEALTGAVQRGAGAVVVRMSLDGGRLLIEVEDDAPPPDAPPLRLVDRIGAAGGGLELIRRPPAGGTLLRAALPCA